MTKKNIIVSVLLFTSLLVLGVLFILRDKGSSVSNNLSQALPIIKINDTLIGVELAKTPKEQTRGLSGKAILPENQGMLFLYDKPGLYSFWMKDMRFPIDIIWIDEGYKVIDITKNIPPESFPNNFRPSSPAQYALEVNAGFADRNNISIGDLVDFSEVLPSQKFKELVFTEDAKNHQVIVLSRDGEIVKRIKVGKEPHDIAVSPDQKFVATGNFGDGTVSIINTSTLSVEKTIKTGRGAHGVVFSLDGKFLFVTNAREDTLSVVETGAFEEQRKITVRDFPEYVGVTKDGSKVFTTNLGGNGSVTVLENNGFQSRVLKTIELGIDPHGWAVSPDGSKIVVTNLGSKFIYLLDAETFDEIARIDTGAATESAAFKDDAELWVTNIGARYISIIDVKNNEVIKQIEVGETPHGISFSSDPEGPRQGGAYGAGKTLAFVPLYKPGEVVMIDVANQNIIKRIKVGEELHNSVIVKIKK